MQHKAFFGFCFGLVCLALPACGLRGRGSATGGGGAASTMTDSGGGGAASTTTESGGGGSATASTGGGGTTTTTATSSTLNPSCTGGFSIKAQVETAGGTMYDCFGSGSGFDLDSDAVVTGVEGDAIVIDTCLPGMGCEPTIVKVRVVSAGFLAKVPTGAFVHATASIWSDGVAICHASAEIVNLPSLQGQANPITSRPLVWLRVESSLWPTSSAGPDIGLTAIEVTDCIPNPGPSDVLDDYRFFDFQDDANETLVHVGEVGTLHVTRDGKPETWTFANGEAGCLADACWDGTHYNYYLTQSLGN